MCLGLHFRINLSSCGFYFEYDDHFMIWILGFLSSFHILPFDVVLSVFRFRSLVREFMENICRSCHFGRVIHSKIAQLGKVKFTEFFFFLGCLSVLK